jgi:hypothetical protein
MTNSDDVQLVQVLSAVPHLRQALGEQWIAREQQTDPVLSSFPLSRTLRIEELQDHVATLDRLLGSFATLPGIADWRRRLQRNGPEFREILTELTFAALLRERGYRFLRPKSGPDFEVEIEAGQSLLAEVTTPRKVAWADDLDNRLWLLGRRFGYVVEIEPLVTGTPILETEIREQLVIRVVQEAKARLEVDTSGTDRIVQEWHEIGLRITWTPSENPGFRGRNSPNSSPLRAFNYLVSAASEKERQLPKDRPCVLVIGTNQLPFPEWHQYLHALRNEVSAFAPFDWNRFPDRVRCLILYSASYVDTYPPKVDVVVKPDDPLTDPPGLDRFIGEMVAAGEAGRQPDAAVVALMARLMDARSDSTAEEPAVPVD